jgi:hypothetical protein
LAASAVIDAKSASAIVAKLVGSDARIGEREEMALIGLLTVRMVERMFGPEFKARAAAALARIERVRPDVMVDRRSGRKAQGSSR